MDKQQIRQELLKKRASFSPEIRREKSQKILESLKGLEVFRASKKILAYFTHKDEVDTLPMIAEILKEKEVYLPKIAEENQFHALPIKNLEELVISKEGIPEPKGDASESYDKEIQLVLVPGLGFDLKGTRLGTGKGYYDRYFEKYAHTVKIGLAYQEQVLDSLPKDSYDVPVNWLITDQNIYQL